MATQFGGAAGACGGCACNAHMLAPHPTRAHCGGRAYFERPTAPRQAHTLDDDTVCPFGCCLSFMSSHGGTVGLTHTRPASLQDVRDGRGW
jgi:hypothetical protein